MPRKTRPRVFAITGAKTFLGLGIIRHLHDRGERVIALDVRKPDNLPEGVGFYRLDLTLPTADALLADLLRNEGVTDLLHLAFLGKPHRDDGLAHELVVIGTMHILHAIQAARVERVIMRSTTMVYGANPDNPNYLREDAPLRGVLGYRWVLDQIEAEHLVEEYVRRNPIPITVLRFAPILGPTIKNLLTRVFSSPAILTLLGYDPLYQIIHEEDALRALILALDHPYRGALNIVGKGVLPFSTLVYLAGKLNLPLPKSAAKALVQGLWISGISPYPPQHLEYLHYLCVADGEQAEKVLGFVAQFHLRDTLESFASVQRGRELRQKAA